MQPIQIGEPAPDFTATDQNGNRISLSDYRGRQPVVIFFYPADNSPICTKEACAFRDAYQDFVEAGAAVIGISGDDVQSHHRFASAHHLPFVLLADDDGTIRRSFHVGRSFGLIPGRVTYVIDKQGIVRHVFGSQILANRHVQEALTNVQRLTDFQP